jgi:hypothetical protein
MPLGFSAKCAACNSPHRIEIDQRLLAGQSNRAVSTWLAETHDERISKDGLRRHKGEHLSISEDIVERVAAAEAVLEVHEGAVQGGVGRIEMLKENAAVMREVRDLGVRVLKLQMAAGDCSKSVAQLVTQSAAEIRQSTQAAMKALGEEAEPDRDQADQTLAHILANPGLVRAAHDLLAEVDLDGDARGDGIRPQQG